MPAPHASDRRGDLGFALLVAVGLSALGIVSHGGLPNLRATTLETYKSDSSIYLSMVAHRWVDQPDSPIDPWSLYNVQTPFRYRILVPWLARQLPFGPVFSLALVHYLSLVGAYVYLILTCRRLGIPRLPSAIGLSVAFTFVSHLSIYSLPWLTDGFILLVLSAMTHAFVVDSFWLFAAWGLVGIFAREVPAVLLPVWCIRNFRRGVIVTALALLATGIERVVLAEPSNAPLHVWLISAMRETLVVGPAGASFWPPRLAPNLLVHIAYCWGWAYTILPLGLFLLPREAWSRFIPIAAALLASAFGMSLVATDTSREFMVLLPVVVIAIAQLVSALARESRVIWLTILLGLAVLQFCLSEQDIILNAETWAAVTARVPLIKIGAVWTIGAAILLRAELTRRARSLMSPM